MITRRGLPWLLQITAMVGLGAVLYPHAADWFATREHHSEVSGYIQHVEDLPPNVRQAQLEEAHRYNQNLPVGLIQDPYSTHISTPQDYLNQLRLVDDGAADTTDDGATDSLPVMGEITYPRIRVNLPVYHGTDDTVLRNGVGHLHGSSLPVGGESTHSVLTAHSGLIHASLFTRLPEARLGDEFQIQVFGETQHYRVDDIRTVLPEQTESLQVVDGEDYVTLITCTPLGVNSHRLLVRGERVDGPSVPADQALAGHDRDAGFPWWALIYVLGVGGTAYLLFAPRPARAHPEDTSVPVSA